MGRNDLGHRIIGARRCGSFHIGHQVRKIVISGFSQMNCVSHPACFPLFAPSCIRIIGRTDQQRCWRQILCQAPANGLTQLGSINLLDPDPSKDLDRRYLAQPHPLFLDINQLEKLKTICANLFWKARIGPLFWVGNDTPQSAVHIVHTMTREPAPEASREQQSLTH